MVAKLPKPTQAAWAANALVREHRDLIDALLDAVDDLREAQEAAVAGKGAEALRDAAAAQREAVDALVDAATKLKPGGRKPSQATLERLRTTLQAAATDEEVRSALDRGRVVADAEGAGAWGLMPGADVAGHAAAYEAARQGAAGARQGGGGRAGAPAARGARAPAAARDRAARGARGAPRPRARARTRGEGRRPGGRPPRGRARRHGGGARAGRRGQGGAGIGSRSRQRGPRPRRPPRGTARLRGSDPSVYYRSDLYYYRGV